MKTIKYLLTAALLWTAASALTAQERRNEYSYDTTSRAVVYYRPMWPIDWRPDPESELYNDISSRRMRRYTLAVHPYHLAKDGLKLDFEMELREPGKWFQLSAMGYYGEDKYSFAGYEEFNRLRGAGIGIGYKAMLTHRGIYLNAALQYNLYEVTDAEVQYVAVPIDGLTYYERTAIMKERSYHQPSLVLNIGKHMAIGRHAFVDMFVGAGYMHSFYSGRHTLFDGFMDFGYRGAYINGGIRLGVLWHNRK